MEIIVLHGTAYAALGVFDQFFQDRETASEINCTAGAVPAQTLQDLRRVRTHEFACLLGVGRSSSVFAVLKAGRLPPHDGRYNWTYLYERTLYRALSSPSLEVAA